MKKIGILVFIVIMMAVATAAQAEAELVVYPPWLWIRSINDCPKMSQLLVTITLDVEFDYRQGRCQR